MIPPQQQRRRWPLARVVLLVIGVVAIFVATYVIVGHNWGSPGSAAACETGEPMVTARGIIGSEKEQYFADPRVVQRLACAGLTVSTDSRGSREMLDALRRPGNGYDFAFPSSTATADKISSDLHVPDRIPLFSSPMAVATFKPIVDVLTRAGMIQTAADGSQVLDIAALLDAARKGVTWNQLPGNTEYPVRKTVLLSTTDPQDSNSAIMYLSIASQVSNHDAVVTTPEQVQAVLPDLCRLVFDQGTKPETSQVLFNSYLVDGMGRIPMALIYEAQYITHAPGQQPALPPDSVLLFPRPTVYSRHTLIPLTDAGRRVGEALRDDPELVRLAAEHGFRPEHPTTDTVSTRKPPLDVVEPPSFEALETMLDALEPTPENARRCAK
ncbi:hypothetical protein [Amycolatopsis sp. GM8]|uniref:hypothetical protein n=1 Tax=Amycolatopsis sp. GM8 TaxID=2896530 RepID=UPI001F3A16DF|nr:hypothetical protein [Amycolatopsis sp. GM8]